MDRDQPVPGRLELVGAEEVEDALGEEGGGVGVVGGQRAVGEVVLVAGVEEQLGVLGLAVELAGGVDVAFACWPGSAGRA